LYRSGVDARVKTPKKIMKKVILCSKNITPKQWSNLILELNLVVKAWKPYAELEISGQGVKKIIKNGTTTRQD
jgi:hypothetical protein